MKEFIGDERGLVVVEFTTKALSELIETWNRALPLDAEGKYVITLSAEEYEPGKAQLIGHISARGEA